MECFRRFTRKIIFWINNDVGQILEVLESARVSILRSTESDNNVRLYISLMMLGDGQYRRVDFDVMQFFR